MLTMKDLFKRRRMLKSLMQKIDSDFDGNADLRVVMVDNEILHVRPIFIKFSADFSHFIISGYHPWTGTWYYKYLRRLIRGNGDLEFTTRARAVLEYVEYNTPWIVRKYRDLTIR